MRKNERMALNEIVESLNEIHNNLEKEKDSSLNSDEYLFDYYLSDLVEVVDDEMFKLKKVIKRLTELNGK
ncbi:hypothetical protein [Ligilactobacillus salivarius]|uniref:Uncharacterized protein n=1 Tax=Ligilactobacillus salivarius TaxID=1624 RepID=A0AAX3X947_9LACO|nr:hypothetical protein [Ligilactobacillus salivarius]WII29702.1 hypothetical protein QFE45_10565 [Ligilactobacillus salivarius]